MSDSRGNEHDTIDWWFRALDQREIRDGCNELRVQVTGIHVEEGEVWIQIADSRRPGASVVLHVSSTTSVEEALQALTTLRGGPGAPAHPIVASAGNQ